VNGIVTDHEKSPTPESGKGASRERGLGGQEQFLGHLPGGNNQKEAAGKAGFPDKSPEAQIRD